jgi:4-hydroxybenzoate polyprenyltransferase
MSQFLFVWALTIPFDFADVESDEKNGTVNFFAHINKKNALIILTVLLLFQLFVNLYFFKNNVLFFCLNFIQAYLCCNYGFKFIKNYWFGEIVELAFFNQWLLCLLFT